MRNDPAYEHARRRVADLRGFYVHLAAFAIVNAFLFLLNVISDPDNLWFFWPLLGWGIGLAAHAAYVFLLDSRLGKDWEDRKIREYMADEERRAREGSR
jgi:hypothetical protein